MSNNKYEEQSRDRLKKIVSSKMRTIMIGALSIIEESLDLDDLDMLDLYESVIRPRILDLGNGKIRDVNKEIDMHTVSWNRYNYKFEVKERKE